MIINLNESAITIPKPKQSKFPGGELYLSLEEAFKSSDYCEDLEEATIYAKLENSDDIMNLVLASNALREEWPGIDLELIIPYISYGRQDRVVRSGEPFSLKSMAQIFNRIIKPKTLYTLDIHSDATKSLMDFKVVDFGHRMLEKVIQNIYQKGKTIDFIIAPDTGASKRIDSNFKKNKESGMHIIDELIPSIISCAKFRDFDDPHGKVDKVTILHDNPKIIEGKNLLIVDDICSGGATFINIAKKLREYNPKSIDLFVSHGIFNKGLAVLWDAGIDVIHATNSRRESENFKGLSNKFVCHNFLEALRYYV